MNRSDRRVSGVDWIRTAADRAEALMEFAAIREVEFSPPEIDRLVAITLQEDARRASALGDALVRRARGW